MSCDTVPTMNLADLSAYKLSEQFASGASSPVDAVRDVLARLAQWNPKINAFCFEDHARTLSDARASEARWQAKTPRSNLDGVPISIKDLILTEGWPTLRGSRTIDPNQPWLDDAPSVARVREAGMVIIGKTTTPEFGIKGTTDNTLTGVTRNPWHTLHTPGGSSGGSAAAVAAGIGPLSIGTDGAGSVRIPAAFTGTFGLKPSFGRVPAWPLSPFGTVAHLGPHSRTVTDAAMLMNVITKPDVRDWTSLPFDKCDYLTDLNHGVKNFRVAFSPALGYAKNVHSEIAVAVRKSADVFTQLGAQVEEIDPGFDDPIEITTKLWFIGSAALYNAMSDAHKKRVDPALAWQAEAGSKVTVSELQLLIKRRAELGVLMRKFHQRFDLLITPGVSVPALLAKASHEWELTVDKFLGWTPFSYPFNLTQQPACVCPCGFTRDGLLMAMQIVGPMHGDALVLRAARAFELAQPWTLMAPE
jgi:aspartyl-tRNA(Asn)/glutamyl-tRNA(Gln) amidotransferase subunit A